MISHKPIILWCGRQTSHDGYGVAARLHVGALRETGADVVAFDLPSGKVVGSVPEATVHIERDRTATRIRALDPDRPITVIVHDRPDRYGKVGATGRSLLVGYSYWETTTVPPDWGGWMTSMDRIWTASEFNRAAFTDAVVPAWMIDKVGHPVDNLARENLSGRHDQRKRWKEATVFLSVVSSVVGRRDLTMLLEAYGSAFSSPDDVALVLKVPDGGSEQVANLIQQVMLAHPERSGAKWPAVYVIAADLSREQLVRLHASVDCYVSCERGDGWDLPAMDSLTLGVPVVSSDFGASMEFLADEDCYLIPTSPNMVSCDDVSSTSHPLYSGQYWPYIDPSELAKRLRHVATNPAERRERGQAAADRVNAVFERTRVARAVEQLATPTSPVDWRSGLPGTVSLFHGDATWPKPRASYPMIEHPKLIEDALFSLLLSPDFLHPRDPRRFLSSYKQATRFAVSHNVALSGSPLRLDVASSMAVPLRSPIAKVVALADLRRRVLSKSSKYGDVSDLIRTRMVLEDYTEAVASDRSDKDAETLESWRRPVWGKYGPFVSPKRDLERLGELRNRHIGERVFILGNGPSLLKCDLSLLSDEYTFAVNKVSLLFESIDWRPDFFTLLDWKMGAAIQADYEALDGIIKFVPERFRGVLPSGSDTYWYWPRAVGTHVDDQFEPDLVKGVPSRATVLVTAIQQAFFLGFRDIYLIGVDASYTIPPTVRQSGPDRFGTGVRINLESTEDDDPNHFAANYFGAGSKWHDPNVNDMRRMFRIMRKGVERHGGRLINATVGGSLDVLERVDYESLFRPTLN